MCSSLHVSLLLTQQNNRLAVSLEFGEVKVSLYIKRPSLPEFPLRKGTLLDREFRARLSPESCPDGSGCSDGLSTKICGKIVGIVIRLSTEANGVATTYLQQFWNVITTLETY